MSRNVLYDGLDIRKEYARVCNLPCWHSVIHKRHPHLNIVIVKKGTVRTLGTARWMTHEIRLRIKPGYHTRHDIMETIVHEVAHIDAQHRENDKAKFEGRLRRQISHGPEFWMSNDIGFAAAHPEAAPLVGPRINKFHGRYAKALRELEAKKNDTVWTVPQGEAKPWVLSPTTLGRLDEAERKVAAAMVELPEPKPEPETKEHYTTAMVDENVRLIVEQFRPCTRDFIQEKYEDHYGKYPGKSVYNSLWRLRRDGRVFRDGHFWRTTV
jgi:hypothetical protein